MQGCPRGTCRHRSHPPPGRDSGPGLSNGVEVEEEEEEGEYGGDRMTRTWPPRRLGFTDGSNLVLARCSNLGAGWERGKLR